MEQTMHLVHVAWKKNKKNRLMFNLQAGKTQDNVIDTGHCKLKNTPWKDSWMSLRHLEVIPDRI